MVERIGQVKQLISSNKRLNIDFIFVAVSAFYATIINFDLKFMKKKVIAYDSRRLCNALSRQVTV